MNIMFNLLIRLLIYNFVISLIEMKQSEIVSSDSSQQSKPNKPWIFRKVQARSNLQYLALKFLRIHQQ